MRLKKGEKLTELLKQKQYSPLLSQEMVCVLFAGVNGYLDNVPTKNINKFEKQYLEFLKASHSDLLSEIANTGKLSKQNLERLASIIPTFIENSGLKTI